MFAHYFASRDRKVLILTATPRLAPYFDTNENADRYEFAVSGKVEARKIAAANGARPWNF